MRKTTTPKFITSSVIAFANKLNLKVTPIYLQAKTESYAKPSFCFPNVHRKIELDGGSIQHGWVIWERLGQFLEAEFHAVWKSPEGELVDITPKIDGETSVVFVAEDSLRWVGLYIPNRLFALTDSSLVETLQDLKNIQCQIINSRYRDGKWSVLKAQQLIRLQDSIQHTLTMLDSNEKRTANCPCGSGEKFKRCHGKY